MNAGHGLTRRGLLLGDTAARTRQTTRFRPPWAGDAARFAAACTRCDACITRCPENVLRRDEDGYPVFDPHLGECVFCGDCADACPAGALQRDDDAPPWQLRARIADTQCLNTRGIVCASCADACPERAIRLPRQLRGEIAVDASACTGCGACVAVCPTDAVALFDLAPEFA